MLYVYKMNALAEAEQKAFLTAVAHSGEAVCLIEETDLNRCVSEVLESLPPLDTRAFVPFEKADGAPFLLMDVDSTALDAILAAMRQHKVRIDHKCMVTENNRNWTVQKLIGDVIEEHALMTALMKLQKMIEEAADINEGDVNPLLWTVYNQKKMQAKELLGRIGNVEIPLETVEETMAQLEKAIQMVREGGKA